VLPSCATSRGRSPIRHLGTRVAAVVPRQVSLSLTRADNHTVCCADIYIIYIYIYIYTSVVHGSQPGPSVITPLWFMCGNYSQTSDSIHIGLTVWSYIVQVSHSLGLTFAFDTLLPGTIPSIRGGRVVRHGPPWCGSIKWIHSLACIRLYRFDWVHTWWTGWTGNARSGRIGAIW